MDLGTMMSLAAAVGMNLELVESGALDANLYAYCAAQGAGHVIYVGKQASYRRTTDEHAWGARADIERLNRFVAVGADGALLMVSAWTATVAENEMSCAHLRFDGLDVDVANAAVRSAALRLAQAHGSQTKELLERYAGSDTAEDVFFRFLSADFRSSESREYGWFDRPDHVASAEAEKFLIRLLVRSGVPVANAQFAGQWESMLDTPADSLAAVALINR